MCFTSSLNDKKNLVPPTIIMINSSSFMYSAHKKRYKGCTRQSTSQKNKPRDDHHTNENETVKIVTEAITFSDTFLLSFVPLFTRKHKV